MRLEIKGPQRITKASTKGDAAAWLHEHPAKICQTNHQTGHAVAKEAIQTMDVASVAFYSILRDWIKGQITAIGTAILSFEGVFLG